MKKSFVLFALVVFCLASGAVYTAQRPKTAGATPGSKPAQVATPSKEAVLAFADKYLKTCEPKLDANGKQAIGQIKLKLFMGKGPASIEKQTVNGLVNQLTVALAGLKKFDALTVASAMLVQVAPGSARTANLFGCVLHISNKISDSLIVLQYALSIKPDNNLIMINLANVYLDLNQDEKAKALADKVVFKESGNMSAHRVLATYWYNKHNYGAFHSELLKASQFKGYVGRKTDKKKQEIEEESAQPNDTTEVLEQKVEKLQDEVPLTTADIIEDDFPSQAQQIRNKYGKLAEDEKMIMPKLPMVNMNDPRNFKRNEPIIKEWAEVFKAREKKYAKDEAKRKGINTNASEEVQNAQAEAAEEKQAAEAMQQAMQNLMKLQQIKGVPGVNPSQLNEAIAGLRKEMQEKGINPEPGNSGVPVTPIVDAGSQLVQYNYYDYLNVSRTYENYLGKYHVDFQYKVEDILDIYNKKVKEADNYHQPIWDKLQEEHNSPGHPHGEKDIPCRREMLRYKKQLNAISDDYYKQWVNYYTPQYAQKMKPTLDAYWKICMLYVRNMNNAKVMEREYLRIRRNYITYAAIAGDLITAGGNFGYEGPTDEEEEQLQKDIEEAENEAKEKKPQMERDFREPGTDWTKWIGDHFVLELSGEFLSLKVTAKTVEFEAWAFGPGAGIKVDLEDETMETYTSVGPKFKVGVDICGIEAEAEAKADIARKVAKWDFANGTYEESYGAKGEVTSAFGPISVGGELEVDTELNANATSKITGLDVFTFQTTSESK